jgi:hypothetical protein
MYRQLAQYVHERWAGVTFDLLSTRLRRIASWYKASFDGTLYDRALQPSVLERTQPGCTRFAGTFLSARVQPSDDKLRCLPPERAPRAAGVRSAARRGYASFTVGNSLRYPRRALIDASDLESFAS